MTKRLDRSALTLPEEILLLALKDEEGTVAPGTLFRFAIGGAVLSELILRERVRVEESKRKTLLVGPTDPSPLGDPLLDRCLEKIRDSKRRQSLANWVSRFANQSDLKTLVAQQLCRKGILRADEDKVLFLFTRRIYPEVDPRPERKLIERLREAIFTDTDAIDSRTLVLVSLANSAHLLQVIFEKKKLKARRRRIKELGTGGFAGKATQEAIQAMQVAVMMATLIPTVIVTTTA